MLSGKYFVIWGLSRLSVRVARTLAAGRATVTVIRLRGETETLLPRLGEGVQVKEAPLEADAMTLRAAGLDQAACLLALSDSDQDNLHAVVAAREAAPGVPVVLRAFDALFADQLEQGGNVRRAYSVSALAAPAFVAAACGDEVRETLRLGDGEVPLCRMTLRTGSPLSGLNAATVKARFGCAALARSSDGAHWQAVAGDAAETPFDVGEQILIGGPRESVLRAVTRNAGWTKTKGRKQRRKPLSLPTRPPTRLWRIAAGLTAILIAAVFVFRHALHLSLVDAVYFVITTASTTGYGDISLKDTPDWLKLFGCVIMLTGGALLGILFSYLAAVATAERLDETMSRKAGRMRGHIVVAGLGNLGYRVAVYLCDLGLEVAVLDLAPRPRFAEALRSRAPVLAGDASLPDNLERVSVSQASAFLAVTSDDLANVQACLHARRLNPQVTTVARIFDDALADQIPVTFGIDQALSASQAAVSAFVGAATDELALRPLPLGDLLFLAGRYVAPERLTAATVGGWRAQGIRVLAYRLPNSLVQPPSSLTLPLPPDSEIILCGPDSALRAVMGA
ncbi:MAG: NAD-binding protein [Janthinobacterium lividum]